MEGRPRQAGGSSSGCAFALAEYLVGEKRDAQEAARLEIVPRQTEKQQPSEELEEAALARCVQEEPRQPGGQFENFLWTGGAEIDTGEPGRRAGEC